MHLLSTMPFLIAAQASVKIVFVESLENPDFDIHVINSHLTETRKCLTTLLLSFCCEILLTVSRYKLIYMYYHLE